MVRSIHCGQGIDSVVQQERLQLQQFRRIQETTVDELVEIGYQGVTHHSDRRRRNGGLVYGLLELAMTKQLWAYILQYLLNGGSIGERIQLGLALNTLRITF